MADKKISALTAASTAASGDQTVLVQSGTTKNITLQTLFQNVPVNIRVIEAAEVVTSGALSTSILTSVITANNNAFTLAAGTTHGQVKEIVVGTFTAASATVTVTSAIGFTTITFGTGTLGSSCRLKWIVGGASPGWYLVERDGKTLATVA